ncbi:SgcJ/EcaC family oxidoreductase [Anaeromyxobacter sp. PSR-1]|uniref:SgcJ/EcaC family oxidoreductase n=1 Tax=Anaeromyxobacter sp. PSR-1 TaxID=1300915 RepID=UPI0005DA9418|nr:SgcJ/EcaC family oxidoreductase [Anaeromyxobacter sp. PSR-1]GAO05358.1 snoaL-like domain protein [Anaeromyxobacter sp. PSR-1]
MAASGRAGRRGRGFALAAAAGLAAGVAAGPGVGAAAGPAAAGSDGDPVAVARAFEEAWNRHDARALAALFSERADFVNVIGLHWRGRAEIERAHAEIHATRMKDSRLTLGATTARTLRPDVALVHASWTLEGDTGLTGQRMPPRRGVLSFVLVRDRGRWVAESAQNTDVVPIPNAPPAAR